MSYDQTTHSSAGFVDNQALQVAVGVVIDGEGNVLLAQRQGSQDFAGFWEFPGGKIQPNESIYGALVRELAEEVGLQIQSARPLIQVRHHYAHKSVLLHAWRVTRYEGEARGCEGQAIAWAAVEQLLADRFPAANAPILSAVRLPSCYALTATFAQKDFWQRFEHLLEQNVAMLCLRAKTLAMHDYAELFLRAEALCRCRGVKLLLHTHLPLLGVVPAQGIHLTAKQLRQITRRPRTTGLVGASCHNLRELQTAQELGLDFAVLSPLKAPRSHPSDLPELGWECFQQWVGRVNIPVYALGGMRLDDLPQAWTHGGQGIAAISAFCSAK